MARLISTQTKITYGIKIINFFNDEAGKEKSESTVLYNGDLVTDLSFIKDKSTKKVSGKITGIDLVFKSATINTASKNDYLVKDCVVNTITVDHSTKNNSNVDVIDAKEIIEYNTTKNITRVAIVPEVKVDLTSILSDGSSSSATFKVGQFLFNVEILNKGKTIVDDYQIIAFAYSNNECCKAKFTGLVLSSSDKENIIVPFEAIKYCGKEGIIVETGTDVRDALERAMTDPTVGGVVLKTLNYYFDISASSIKIDGANTNVSAVIGERCSDITPSNETVIYGALSCLDGADIVVNGVTFTKASKITIGKASSVTFKNCRFVAAEPSAAKSYYILGDITTEPVLYRFENCYFGSNPNTSTGKVYNLFEISSLVADGSYIKNCYFKKECCAHNIINIYDVEDGATIDIVDNIFEYSCNASRIGIKGNKHAVINYINNTYYETDTDPNWGGLVLVQPYGTQTTSFENVVINLNGTKNKTNNPQLIYLYCGRSDTKITKETEPRVYINGKLTSLIKD